jgi:glutamate-5-semialdehyde dehydrogenase
MRTAVAEAADTSRDAVRGLAHDAKTAAHALRRLSSEQKNQTLQAFADGIRGARSRLEAANAEDLRAAGSIGLSPAMIDRLRLSPEVIDSMVEGLHEVAALPDPVGAIPKAWVRPNGLRVGKMRIPLGVILIIYESRPNVTVDAAALCLKAGNAVVLRGWKEAFHSNQVLGQIMQEALELVGLPRHAIQVVPTTDREAMNELLTLEDDIDLVIPRGGEALIRFVSEHSRIPVIKHYKGTCHVYVDEFADVDMGVSIIINAKTQRPGVCNAAETLLVHERIAPAFLPAAGQALVDAGVELRACPETARYLRGLPHRLATEDDWPAEYLDLILAVRTVPTFEAAVDHIARFGSLHTETIVTNDYGRSQQFLREVNSSCVFINASTRFSDGFQLGLGAEIGISTTKLHAFGPMGLEELTTEKFFALGEGHIRR